MHTEGDLVIDSKTVERNLDDRDAKRGFLLWE
jgi:hypothetical protein